MNVLHEPIIALTLRLSVKPLSPPSRKTGRVGGGIPQIYSSGREYLLDKLYNDDKIKNISNLYPVRITFSHSKITERCYFCVRMDIDRKKLFFIVNIKRRG
jgi:hypothetical protein